MKRVRRIYPGFIVAFIICLWIIVPIGSPEGGAVFSWNTLVSNSWRLLTLRGFICPNTFVSNPAPFTVNGSLWSISYEFWCYIGIMLLGAFGLLRRKEILLALCIVVIFIHFYLERKGWTPGGKILGDIVGNPRIWARLLPCFLSGTLLYLYREKVLMTRYLVVIALMIFLVCGKIPNGLVFAIPMLISYVLIYISFTHDIEWHTASTWGDMSYGIYLYAFPIQQLVMLTIGHPTEPIFLFALSLPLTLMAGFLSWHLVEKHFLPLKAEKTSQRLEVVENPAIPKKVEP